MTNIIKRETCSDCFRIVCRACGWVPDDSQVTLIQRELLTACPNCGWKPGQSVDKVFNNSSFKNKKIASKSP